MKSWAVLVAAIALAACSTGEPVPEPDAQVSAELSAQAVENACSNAGQTYEIVYVQDELVKLGGSARKMPEKIRSAISGLGEVYRFQWDGTTWVPTTEGDAGVPVTQWVS